MLIKNKNLLYYTRYLIFFMLFILLFSCESYLTFINDLQNYVVNVEFNSGYYEVFEEGLTVVYVQAEPVDSFDYYDSEFTIVNEEVAQIVEQTDSYCVIQGIKKGQTILSIKLSNKESKTIINVL